MKPKGSFAPFPFPKEGTKTEDKVYGVPESEWKDLTPGQQSVIRNDYVKNQSSDLQKGGSDGSNLSAESPSGD